MSATKVDNGRALAALEEAIDDLPGRGFVVQRRGWKNDYVCAVTGPGRDISCCGHTLADAARLALEAAGLPVPQALAERK